MTHLSRKLLVLALIGVVGILPVLVLAQEDCQSGERQTLRRRPNASTSCHDVAAPTTRVPTSVPVEVKTPKATSGQRTPFKSTVRPPAVVERVPVRPKPVSPVPRPKLTDYPDSVVVPDRWRIVDALGYEDNWFDPYHRNTLKADKPLHGDWFFNLGLVSDTVFEARRVATPVGGQSSGSAGSVDVFGSSDQQVLVENLAVELVYYQGDTTFRPPDYEFRFTPVFNLNRTQLDEIQGVNVDPQEGKTRNDNHVGIQAAFVDKHLRNVSPRFDFDSLRVGIQPFTTDFRGFLYQDSPFGIRFFGNRANNVFQYNLAWFRRLAKDTNSGLNDLGAPLRDDDVFVFNVYWQDMPRPGFSSQGAIVYNRNRESGEPLFDTNGFIVRPASIGFEQPHDYDVVYLGYNGDGHYGRLNLTTSIWYALGQDDKGLYVQEETDIAALMVAAEISLDFDWQRYRLSFYYGSGDDDPFDDTQTGFDAILENPQFAGADTSYWIRQAVPLIAGGKVSLSGRNGLLNSLRSSKDEGQSNFTNPGVVLLGVGADYDVLPELRLSWNVNELQFDDTAVLEVARSQGQISQDIGLDVSLAATYRPLMSQNIVLRASHARLFAGQGYNELFDNEDPDYLLLNLILTY